jgi:hypothetical protein
MPPFGGPLAWSQACMYRQQAQLAAAENLTILTVSFSSVLQIRGIGVCAFKLAI